MTEAEWLAGTDPQAMLEHLCSGYTGICHGASDRKLRLFCCACCLLNGTPVSAVDEYEQHGAPATRLTDLEWAQNWCTAVASPVPSLAARAHLLLEVVGNPFRPVGMPWVQDPPVNSESNPPYCPWLTWNRGLVPAMARDIYDRRAWEELPALADALEEAGCADGNILRHLRGWKPTGHGSLIRISSEPIQHCRGCWVLDLLLGKE